MTETHIQIVVQDYKEYDKVKEILIKYFHPVLLQGYGHALVTDGFSFIDADYVKTKSEAKLVTVSFIEFITTYETYLNTPI